MEINNPVSVVVKSKVTCCLSHCHNIAATYALLLSTTLNFIIPFNLNFLLEQFMSIKQQLPCLSLLYSIYEEVPEQTLDEADVDSYFYHNILDVTKTDNRLVRVSKGSNKNLFAIKGFKFCDLKAQQRFFLDEENSITKKARCGPKQTASLFKTIRPRTKGNSISPTKTVTRDWLYAVEGRTLLTL